MRFITAAATCLTLLSAFPAAAAPARKAAQPAKAAPAAAAPASSGGGLDLSQASVSAFIGGEFGDADGFYLRADGSMPIMPLSPTVDLRGVASLGFTRFSEDVPYGSASTNIFKLLGSGRGQMNLAPQFDMYADLGLGFYFYNSSYEVSFMGVTTSGSDSGGGLTMRIAAGGLYEISPQMKLGAELGFNPYFGDVDTTEFFIGAGIEYKL